MRFLVRGGDLNTLRLLLGHTTIAVTQMYLKLTHQNIAEVYARNSPMDGMSLKLDGRRKAAARALPAEVPPGTGVRTNA